MISTSPAPHEQTLASLLEVYRTKVNRLEGDLRFSESERDSLEATAGQYAKDIEKLQRAANTDAELLKKAREELTDARAELDQVKILHREAFDLINECIYTGGHFQTADGIDLPPQVAGNGVRAAIIAVLEGLAENATVMDTTGDRWTRKGTRWRHDSLDKGHRTSAELAAHNLPVTITSLGTYPTRDPGETITDHAAITALPRGTEIQDANGLHWSRTRNLGPWEPAGHIAPPRHAENMLMPCRIVHMPRRKTSDHD